MKKTLSLLLCSLLTFLTIGCKNTPPAASPIDQHQPLMEQIVSRTENGYSFLGLDWGMRREDVLKKLGLTQTDIIRETADRFVVSFHTDELNTDGSLEFIFENEEFQLGVCVIQVDPNHKDAILKWVSDSAEVLTLDSSCSEDWLSGKNTLLTSDRTLGLADQVNFYFVGLSSAVQEGLEIDVCPNGKTTLLG
ncbi:MAG: hypothetical protein PUC59_10080 [Firmicutes bacterium]|nr:hypothetical protein [Bacillota bacterium]